MAFGKKSNFANYIGKGSFFEAFIEYMGDEDACEEELERLVTGHNKAVAEDFLQYVHLWNRFRELVLQGAYDEAKEIVTDSSYGEEMGALEIRSVLNDLAGKTNSFYCYCMYWLLCGADTVEEHEFALTMLNDSLQICPERKEVALEHLWWLVNNTQKKQKLKYAELGLAYFLLPNTFVPSADASILINIARSINPKSKEALKTEYLLFERDKGAIAAIRQLIQEGDYQAAIDTLENADVSTEQSRRVLLRGVLESKPDAAAFAGALKYLYNRTGDPMDAFTAASAVWHCDLRKNEQELSDSMALALSVLDELPHRDLYTAALLDALYLMDPYPLPDAVAVSLAGAVLAVDPENEIALECMAIAKEQAEKEN